MAAHTFSPSAGETEAGRSLEFKASLVYIESSRTTGAITVRLCLKKERKILSLMHVSEKKEAMVDHRVAQLVRGQAELCILIYPVSRISGPQKFRHPKVNIRDTIRVA